MWASLFTEEISLVVLEQNASGKQKLLIEISLLFDENAVRLIERDSGQIFDVTDPELQVKGLSSFIIEGLMEAYKEKAYLTTTGYNRNIMWFPASEEEIFEEVSFRRKERAEAEGNIYIHDAALHSNIRAGKKIVVSGKRGLVNGGYLAAGEEIQAATIGNPMNVVTRLVVGVNPMLQKKYQDACKEYKESKQRLDQLMKTLNTLEKIIKISF